MPVNLDLPAAIAVPGIRVASVAAGIKSNGSTDLVLFALPHTARCAAVFTQSHFAAAPVTVAREHLAASDGAIRALLINSGNANAGTGEPGIAMARQHCAYVGDALGVAADSVLPFSTGVIGQMLPDAAFVSGVPAAVDALSDDWQAAARGIMTTDTEPKITSRQIDIDGTAVTLTGMVKGSGMIQPNMATMLAYVFTDAAIDADALQGALDGAVAESFNAITVDSDTSTNDACVLCSTGEGPAVAPDSPGWHTFTAALDALCLDLAQAVIRDGEGASKFITVNVAGGEDRTECRTVAYAIANSPLVKTAMFASDANVGRLLMAIGKADTAPLDSSAISVSLDELVLFENGGIAATYTEAQGAALLAKPEITVNVDLGRGAASATVYTSDLSHDYVSINADYRS